MRQESRMTHLIFTATLTIITIQVSLCGAGSDGAPPDEESETTTVPRLIRRQCNRRRFYNKPETFQVPCVPRDFDAICRSKNFLRAIAVGNPERPDTLRRHLCLVGRRRGRYGSCPLESTCVRQRYWRGVCCYGDLSGSSGANAVDLECPDLCAQPCPSGERCQKCGDGFTCLPEEKPGRCPAFTWRARSCWGAKSEDKCWCQNDNDCEGNKKCCYSFCFGRRCSEPDDAPDDVCPSTTPEPSSTTESSTSTTESSTSTTESSTSTTESSTSTTSGDPPL